MCIRDSSLEDDYGQGSGNASNAVRSILAGANSPGGNPLNTISFLSVSTLGNAKDFGDLATVRRGTGAVASGTRAVFGGGRTPSDVNIIDYVEIATTGNATDFGDLTNNRSFRAESADLDYGAQALRGYSFALDHLNYSRGQYAIAFQWPIR